MITLRPATREDTNFARATHHAAYREVVEKQFGLWNETEQDRFFDKSWDPETHEILLCKEKPCGYIHQETRSSGIHLHELVIHPEFQNQGIGSSILQNIIEKASSKDLPVLLQAFHTNRALSLYQKFGFEEYGRTATHILLRKNPERKGSE